MTKRRRKKARKNLMAFLLMLVIAGGLVFGGYKLLNGNNSQDDGDEDYVNPEKPKEPELQIVNTKSKSRPYGVMINNIGAARPYHTGLQDAYLVYEIVVEGGITRYMALFKDKPLEVVGNVRSSRHYFLDYALENDAYYVHWGWSPQAQSDIKSLKVNNLNGLTESKPYFFRQNLPVSTEHTAFVNLREMENLVKKKKYRTETTKPLLLKYSVKPMDFSDVSDKQDALNVDLKYSNSSTTNYVYDSTLNAYKQYVNNKEHTDYVSKKQYTVKNIIVYQVKNSSIGGDDKGRQDIQNIGSGNGYFITGGVSIPITWEKTSRDAQTVYRYMDGTEITVNDGNTWIHIVPSSGNVSIS